MRQRKASFYRKDPEDSGMEAVAEVIASAFARAPRGNMAGHRIAFVAA
jgi:hypothetical protein